MIKYIPFLLILPATVFGLTEPNWYDSDLEHPDCSDTGVHNINSIGDIGDLNSTSYTDFCVNVSGASTELTLTTSGTEAVPRTMQFNGNKFKRLTINGDYIEVQGIHIDQQNTGPASKIDGDHVTIAASWLHNSRWHLLNVYGTDAVIKRNRLGPTPKVAEEDHNCIYILTGADDFVVKNNIFENCAGDGIQVESKATTESERRADPDGGLIKYNVFFWDESYYTSNGTLLCGENAYDAKTGKNITVTWNWAWGVRAADDEGCAGTGSPQGAAFLWHNDANNQTATRNHVWDTKECYRIGTGIIASDNISINDSNICTHED